MLIKKFKRIMSQKILNEQKLETEQKIEPKTTSETEPKTKNIENLNLKKGCQLTLSICYKPGDEELLNKTKIRKKFLIVRFVILKISIKFNILMLLLFFENTIRNSILPLFNDDVLFYYFNINNDKKEGEKKPSFLEHKRLIREDMNGKVYSFSKGL